MKRISLLALIVCACLVSVAWSQQRAPIPPMGRHAGPRGLANYLKQNSLALSPHIGMQAAYPQANKVYDLRHHPDGSWAELDYINDFGIASGWGDVASGETHMLGVPIFGPNAGKWFESGLNSTEGWAGEGGGISLFGLIVGHVKGENGRARAYAWTADRRVSFDLGTLPGDEASVAIAVNRLGSLIVGASVRILVDDPNGLSGSLTPVVWAPKFDWRKGQQSLTWEIHALPKGGLDQPGAVFENVILNNWGGWGVNDLGQIVGDAWSDYGNDEIAVMWTPTLRGGWKIQQLPRKSPVAEFVNTEALSINNRGEIVGDTWGCTDEGCTALPALWKVRTPRNRTSALTALGTLSGLQQGWNVAWAINDVGDAVGVSNDADWNWLATRWKSKNPSTAIVLGFPGDSSVAYGVNNFGIAVGTYGIGEEPEQAAAVGIH